MKRPLIHCGPTANALTHSLTRTDAGTHTHTHIRNARTRTLSQACILASTAACCAAFSASFFLFHSVCRRPPPLPSAPARMCARCARACARAHSARDACALLRALRARDGARNTNGRASALAYAHADAGAAARGCVGGGGGRTAASSLKQTYYKRRRGCTAPVRDARRERAHARWRKLRGCGGEDGGGGRGELTAASSDTSDTSTRPKPVTDLSSMILPPPTIVCARRAARENQVTIYSRPPQSSARGAPLVRTK